MKKRLAPGLAVATLGDRDDRQSPMPSSASTCAPQRAGPCRRRRAAGPARAGGRPSLRRRARRAVRPPRSRRREAASHHLAHHAVVVAGRHVRRADVELAVVVLGEAFRPGDDHGADGIGAHDVRIVVDLDPPRRLAAGRSRTEPDEQPRLARSRRAFAPAPRVHWHAHGRPARASRRVAAPAPRLCGRRFRKAPSREARARRNPRETRIRRGTGLSS